MKEVFRDPGLARVGLYRSVLEAAGIPCFIRNESTQQSLVTGAMTAIVPLPDFWPTLCVLDDADYPEAMRILKSDPSESAAITAADWTCTHCGESVPGNFETCWSCEGPRPDARA